MIPAARSGLAALAVCASAATASAARDPDPLRIELRLAADPERRGPPAWTWLRTEFLPGLRSAWPVDLDPLQPCAIDWSGNEFAVRAAPPVGGADYLRATLSIEGVGTVHARCDFEGREVWETDTLRLTAGPAVAHWHALLDTLGLLGESEAVTYDTAALVGNRCPALAVGDPLAPLLTLGAAECGPVTLAAHVDAIRGTLRAVGRSRGGLLLPAALYVLADREGAAARDDLPPTTERWLLLATAARDARREEAARQLALSWDLDALDTLERLLLCDDYTRVVAMDALLHRPDATAHLDRILDAATPAIADSEAIASSARARIHRRDQEAAAVRDWLLRVAVVSALLLLLVRRSRERQQFA
jgi:hypothetical protein